MTKIGTRDEYKKILWDKKMIGKECCPFCEPDKYVNIVLWRGKHWQIIQNKFPYSGTTEHIMAVPLLHKAFSTELTIEEFWELSEIHSFMKSFFADKHYFSCTRESISNRTIEHLHIHFIPGKLQGKYLRKMLQNQGFPIDQDINI